jgi:hypothetical protein
MAKALILLRLMGQSMGPNEDGMNPSYMAETGTSTQYFSSLSECRYQIRLALDLVHNLQGSSKDGPTLTRVQWSDYETDVRLVQSLRVLSEDRLIYRYESPNNINMSNDYAAFQNVLRQSRSIIAVAGAGLSAASGA